jgi:hypothetical protein
MKNENELLAGQFSDLIKQGEERLLLEIGKAATGQPADSVYSVLYDIAHTSAKYGALRADSWKKSFKTQFADVEKLMQDEKK